MSRPDSWPNLAGPQFSTWKPYAGKAPSPAFCGHAHWGGGSLSEPPFPWGDTGTLQEHWRLFLPCRVKVRKQLLSHLRTEWHVRVGSEVTAFFSFLVPSRSPLQGELDSLSRAHRTQRRAPRHLVISLCLQHLLWGRKTGRVCAGGVQVQRLWSLPFGGCYTHGNDNLVRCVHPAAEASLPFREEPLTQPMRLHPKPTPPERLPLSCVQEENKISITGTFSFSLRLSLSLEDWSRVILGRSPRRSEGAVSLCFVSASGFLGG